MLSGNDIAQACDDECQRRDTTASLVGRADRFGQVFAEHAPAILRFAAVRVGPQQAEDVVADTFISAFGARSNYDPNRSSLRAWLYGVASVQLRRHREAEALWLKRLSRSVLATEPAGRGSEAFAEADLINDVDSVTMRPELMSALAQLSMKEREVLLLHALGELDHVEIGRVLGIREGASKTRLSRARKSVQAYLNNSRERNSR